MEGWEKRGAEGIGGLPPHLPRVDIPPHNHHHSPTLNFIQRLFLNSCLFLYHVRQPQLFDYCEVHFCTYLILDLRSNHFKEFVLHFAIVVQSDPPSHPAAVHIVMW